VRWLATTLVAACVLGILCGPATAQDRNLEDLIGELEALLEAEKEKPDHDRDLVRRLEGIVARFKARTGGGGGGGNGSGGPGNRRGGPGGSRGSRDSWSGAGWIIDRVLGDIELKAEEREAVRRILTEFYVSWRVVRDNRDMDSYPEVQRDRNNRLARAVGQKKAREIIQIIDPMIDRWNRWGGRGR
jgi:hypothetical protein